MTAKISTDGVDTTIYKKAADIGESNSTDLLATASRHYTQLPPHVRARETSKLMEALIKQNKEMRKSIKELVIWHGHSEHCKSMNGHPSPENDRCLCYIGRAKKLIGN